MIQIPIPLIPTEEGGLLIPAEQVTALLRRVAEDWQEATDADETDADAPTVLAMTGVLNRLADQIDAECIACTTASGEAH
ncbi:DUF6213 family protein [Streptomyces subrutilus]|uniref:Uncharacterized protein n=1 Tax=Streptomyces subrutilus TaxID=36818 RepID=A0A5P2UT45_9ACTN|nr:DUF6213 family protein [Streptomyces subrutilus]QEU82040.1 hypothetical protein CP968_30565 [Streptomyces subrutilus]WSJ28500.1 DUF6213 family protein [Streptomyces subrutilus]GGZ72798.1 hypothetical protein GCM10010371_35920 [Streptomyces subrutilus]